MLAAIIMHVEYTRGVHSSGLIFIFWLLQVVVGIVPFRSYIIDEDQVRVSADGIGF